MRFGLRFVAQIVLGLTSVAVYRALGALHAPGGVLTSVVLVALLTFVAIFAHELSHAGVAYLVGARIHAIVALPFRMRMRPIRFDLIKRGAHRGDLGGYVSYTLDRIDARRKRAIIAAAGPLANMVLAVLAGTMAPLFDHRTLAPRFAQVVVPTDAASARSAPPDDFRPVLHAMSTDNVTLKTITLPDPPLSTWTVILTAFAILSAGLGLANLIPYDGSDGAQLIRGGQSERERR